MLGLARILIWRTRSIDGSARLFNRLGHAQGHSFGCRHANRQRAARPLSNLVDVLLVVGAKNNSNADRLREIGAEANVASYLIADKTELDREAMRGAGTIGITAGASAPEILVHEVMEKLRSRGPLEVSLLPGEKEDMEFRLPAELLDARDRVSRIFDRGSPRRFAPIAKESGF